MRSNAPYKRFSKLTCDCGTCVVLCRHYYCYYHQYQCHRFHYNLHCWCVSNIQSIFLVKYYFWFHIWEISAVGRREIVMKTAKMMTIRAVCLLVYACLFLAVYTKNKKEEIALLSSILNHLYCKWESYLSHVWPKHGHIVSVTKYINVAACCD